MRLATKELALMPFRLCEELKLNVPTGGFSGKGKAMMRVSVVKEYIAAGWVGPVRVTERGLKGGDNCWCESELSNDERTYRFLSTSSP